VTRRAVTPADPDVRGRVIGLRVACGACQDTAWLGVLQHDLAPLDDRVAAWAAQHYDPRIVTVDTYYEGQTVTWELPGDDTEENR
jgi:hypothetical protein